MITRQQALLLQRRTKIVATLGPSSATDETIGALIDAGANVVRLNMSHGDHHSHQAAFDCVQRAAAHRRVPVAVLADLCGPKIRLGRFEDGGVDLVEGARVVVTTRDVVGRAGLLPSQYDGLARDVTPGSRILLADGMFELRVESIEGDDVACTVVHGGRVTDRKGINLPDVSVSAPSLTPKDREDAVFAVGLGVDYLALSFVRRAEDIRDLRTLLGPDSTVRIIAKIEKPEAMANLDEIADAADGLMVARGDLGVELPLETVPIAQRRLLAAAQARSKPVIVATQMLESMIEHPQPTRAEVSDIANAVFGGADAVMLSAESASGQYPVRAVAMLDKVAREAETYQWQEWRFGPARADVAAVVPLHDAVARALAQLSRDLMVRAIVVFSAGGATAQVVSGARPAAPVLACTTDPATWRRMNLLWGVLPVLVDDAELDDQPALARRLAAEMGLAAAGQYVLTLAGFGAGSNPPTVSVLEV